MAVGRIPNQGEPAAWDLPERASRAVDAWTDAPAPEADLGGPEGAAARRAWALKRAIGSVKKAIVPDSRAGMNMGDAMGVAGIGTRLDPGTMNGWIESELNKPRDLSFSRSKAGQPTPTWDGMLSYSHKDAPLDLDLGMNPKGYPDHWSPKFLSLDGSILPSAEEAAQYGGAGRSTDLYLAALKDAQSAGKGWASDTIRTDATNKMYPRLQGMGVPFKLEGESRYGIGGRYAISPEELAKVKINELPSLLPPAVAAAPALRRLLNEPQNQEQ